MAGQGVFAAIPFAIWFFLAIEGVANVAEEAINPQRTMLIGFGSAILTLVILCVLTFISSVGVAGWEAIVYKPDGSTSDSPLPLALGHIVGNNNVLYHLLDHDRFIWIGRIFSWNHFSGREDPVLNLEE